MYMECIAILCSPSVCCTSSCNVATVVTRPVLNDLHYTTNSTSYCNVATVVTRPVLNDLHYNSTYKYTGIILVGVAKGALYPHEFFISSSPSHTSMMNLHVVSSCTKQLLVILHFLFALTLITFIKLPV